MAAVATTDAQPITPPATPDPLPEAPQDCRAVNQLDWDVRMAYAICMAEAKKTPEQPYGIARWNNAGLNKDGSVDYGLMQINSVHADMVGGNLESLYDPATNIKIAYSLSYGGKDWTAWSTYNNGSYREYLQ